MFWKKLVKKFLAWCSRKRWNFELRWKWMAAGQVRKKLEHRGVVPRAKREVAFPKVVWYKGMLSEPGEYIVKHKGRTKRAIWRSGWVSDFRDKVFIKGVYAWRSAPENLIKIF